MQKPPYTSLHAYSAITSVCADGDLNGQAAAGNLASAVSRLVPGISP